MLPQDNFETLYANLLNDQRLSVCHFSIYMALILLWHKNELLPVPPIAHERATESAQHPRSLDRRRLRRYEVDGAAVLA